MINDNGQLQHLPNTQSTRLLSLISATEADESSDSVANSSSTAAAAVAAAMCKRHQNTPQHGHGMCWQTPRRC